MHGTGGSPESNWISWVKAELKECGYEVWVPLLPNNSTPQRRLYNDFLLESDWNLVDNLVIGHSSGAVGILNLLEDERCPHIKTAVLVSAWADTSRANLAHDGLTRERFKDLFPSGGFKFNIIKQKADHFLFIHGTDDPYCPLDQAEWLTEKIDGKIIIVPAGGHLNKTSGFTKLPQLTQALKERNWL